MRQRGINVLMFTVLGVILGILLAVLENVSSVRGAVLVLGVCAATGAFIGSQWTTPTLRHHAGLDDKR